MYTVYKMTLQPTGKSYIGCTNNLKRRFQQHRSQLKKGVHTELELQEDYNAYGGPLTVIPLGSAESAKEGRQLEAQMQKMWETDKEYNKQDPRWNAFGLASVETCAAHLFYFRAEENTTAEDIKSIAKAHYLRLRRLPPQELETVCGIIKKWVDEIYGGHILPDFDEVTRAIRR